MCSDPGAKVLFPTMEALRWMKRLRTLQIESHGVGLLSSFSGRGHSEKQTSKGKFSLR